MIANPRIPFSPIHPVVSPAVLVLAFSVAGCGPRAGSNIGSSAGSDPGHAVVSPASELDPAELKRYVLTDAEVFDLGIPGDLFQQGGRSLAAHPHIRSCHIQGAALADGYLLLSCVLYNAKQHATRTYTSKAFVLRTRLCDVIGCEGARPPLWDIEDVTEAIPRQHSLRITRELLQKETLTGEEAAITHLMTHPGGMLRDPKRGGVWLGNAGYAGNTYAHFVLMDPAAVGSGVIARAKRTIPIEGHHVNLVALVDDRYAVAPTWGSRGWVALDLESDLEPGRNPVRFANPLVGSDDYIDYQDCIRWPGPFVVCGGNRSYEVDPAAPGVPLAPEALAEDEYRDTIRVRIGRIQVLRFDMSRFPAVSFELVAYWSAVLPGSDTPTAELGIRKYRYDDAHRKVMLVQNHYGGGYKLPLTLPYEGMAIDAERQHVYFVPEDLPQGKLIRMRLSKR